MPIERYLDGTFLGIECDGAGYHDSRSARDRDRLRQAVLETHGWNIHRIWSSDWFKRPKAELEKVVRAIERAKANALEMKGKGEIKRRAVNVELVTIERDNLTEVGLQPTGHTENTTLPYEEAVLRPRIRGELHEAPIAELINLIRDTVTTEGPVHRDEIIARIRTAWGLQRAGHRINAHISLAINAALRDRISKKTPIACSGKTRKCT